MMAANSGSSGVFDVPPPCGRARCSGISGLAISHKPPVVADVCGPDSQYMYR
jgi:hypothetical protein